MRKLKQGVELMAKTAQHVLLVERVSFGQGKQYATHDHRMCLLSRHTGAAPCSFLTDCRRLYLHHVVKSTLWVQKILQDISSLFYSIQELGCDTTCSQMYFWAVAGSNVTPAYAFLACALGGPTTDCAPAKLHAQHEQHTLCTSRKSYARTTA